MAVKEQNLKARANCMYLWNINIKIREEIAKNATLEIFTKQAKKLTRWWQTQNFKLTLQGTHSIFCI